MASNTSAPVEYVATTRIGEKGQVTIPKGYRDEAGLAVGSAVAVLRIGEGLILLPEQTRFKHLCDSIASVLASQGVKQTDLERTLPETRKRIFAERYPGLAKKLATKKHRRSKAR